MEMREIIEQTLISYVNKVIGTNFTIKDEDKWLLKDFSFDSLDFINLAIFIESEYQILIKFDKDMRIQDVAEIINTGKDN
ncbi:hypothetical protein AF435_14660 [Listeria monocytogenes]|uniref:Acyl carrier protein n=1 Tax=Listeria monocytogenes TaxID=1639 RepID=A0AAN2WI06_LISMN|nr:hypothetical protein [Listeria monocytogenes]EAC3367780.1 hypothetical protein [Listeria monocytogenes]EAC7086942.1 hypothetical protein [Listeria monocytogenes]EAC8542035.1 hypothetical protein [Listeria monocytogenes]EAC8548037.1 hypothetical protein [Listeria monocytogenes]